MENTPAWYQSTAGPQISSTLKGVVGLLLPVVMQLTGVNIGGDVVGPIIDALLILGFGAYALYGYYKARKALGARINTLRNELTLASAPRTATEGGSI